MIHAPCQAAARNVLARARRADVDHLLESDAKTVLDAIGVSTPRRILVRDAPGAESLPNPPLSGSHVVLKAVAPGLLHKTEAGAVRIIPADRTAVISEIRAMTRRLDGYPIEGFLLEERVPYDAALGNEFLLGLRYTPDLGPVVTLGAGGIHAELLASAMREEEALAVFSPYLTGKDGIERALERVAAVRLATRPQRGRPPRIAIEALADVVRRFLSLARSVCPELLLELEVNPLVVSGRRLVALDALATCPPLGAPAAVHAPPRPIEAIEALLEPGSIALVGVSEKSMNPGRIILRNVLRAGFDPGRLVVVKPGTDTIDGVRCVPSLDALPEEPAFHGSGRRADLIVLSVSATVSTDLIEAIARERRGEAVILIPGGLEEHEPSGGIVSRMRQAIERSRNTAWRGPVVNGGNCLGIRSVPGRYDTLFIPENKLPRPARPVDPIALVAGSGAFAVSKSSKLSALNPVYTISIGNQTDLTAADYLEHLRGDPRVEVIAVYLEGFRPLDGPRFLAAAAEITASGRAVILYRGGRTQAGHAAASSHTAAIAGDHVLTRALARDAGILVAETLEEFEDLTRLFAALRGRPVEGLSLGAVTNAGYEAVAIADNLGPFSLASFSEATSAALRGVLERSGLGSIATVRNPLDVTPILDDAGYEEVVRAVLGDPGVDVGIVGCVPLTGALRTLPRAEDGGAGLGDADGIVTRLTRIAGEGGKPWLMVVDAGPLYDPMVRALEEGGVPVFRSADRALHALALYCEARHRPRWVGTARSVEPEPAVVGSAPLDAPHRGVALLWS